MVLLFIYVAYSVMMVAVTAMLVQGLSMSLGLKEVVTGLRAAMTQPVQSPLSVTVPLIGTEVEFRKGGTGGSAAGTE